MAAPFSLWRTPFARGKKSEIGAKMLLRQCSTNAEGAALQNARIGDAEFSLLLNILYLDERFTDYIPIRHATNRST